MARSDRKHSGAILDPLRRRSILGLFVVAAVATAVYANTLYNDFVIDDNHQAVDNPLITNPKRLLARLRHAVGAKLFRVNNHTPGYFTEPFVSRWVFDVEILARMRPTHAGLCNDRVYELALRCWRDLPGSKVKPFDFARACRDLVRIRRQYFHRNRAVHQRSADD